MTSSQDGEERHDGSGLNGLVRTARESTAVG